MESDRPLIREAYPVFAAELTALLDAVGERALAVGVRDLRWFAGCDCGDDFCQGFHTAEPPAGAFGEGHRCVPLSAERGMLCLDVVFDRIMFVEVIDRPPLR
ncbi:MAG TPA: hypothetical protein VGF17_27475 [Phytomonospora sp.]